MFDYQYRDGVHLAPAVGIPLHGTFPQVSSARQGNAQLGRTERGGADHLCYHVYVGESAAQQLDIQCGLPLYAGFVAGARHHARRNGKETALGGTAYAVAPFGAFRP